MASSRPLLIDTNVFLWSTTNKLKLSLIAQTAIDKPNAKLVVSFASVWEMQIKHGLGKLELPGDAIEVAQRYARALRAEFLPINLEHFSALYKLPHDHRDPFDRILAAQAIADNLTLVSPDPAFRKFPVDLLW